MADRIQKVKDRIMVMRNQRGLTGPAGSGLTWDNAGWITSTAYVVNDALLHNSTSYRCTVNHTSGATTEPGVGASWATVWEIVAAKADNYAAATQVQAETSNGTTLLSWTAQRIWQAIEKWWDTLAISAKLTDLAASWTPHGAATDATLLFNSSDNGGGGAVALAYTGAATVDVTLPGRNGELALDAEKQGKVQPIVSQGTSFNTNTLDDVTDNCKMFNCTAAITITLETATDKPAGFQIGGVANGGAVTFAGLFNAPSGKTICPDGGTWYVIQLGSEWHVGGVTS